jgi:hypothetical protein
MMTNTIKQINEGFLVFHDFPKDYQTLRYGSLFLKTLVECVSLLYILLQLVLGIGQHTKSNDRQRYF